VRGPRGAPRAADPFVSVAWFIEAISFEEHSAGHRRASRGFVVALSCHARCGKEDAEFGPAFSVDLDAGLGLIARGEVHEDRSGMAPVSESRH